MKRYMLFEGDVKYPIGGMDDFERSYDTLKEAKDDIAPETEWFHIYDNVIMEIVEDSNG